MRSGSTGAEGSDPSCPGAGSECPGGARWRVGAAGDTNFFLQRSSVDTEPPLPLSIVAPTFSLDKFDNNVAPVIGQRRKETPDWLGVFSTVST